MRRHAPIPSLTVELVPVYRCGTRGRRYLRKWVAYRSAAQQAWLRRHCVCEGDTDTCAGEKSDRYMPDEYGRCDCHDAPERDETVKRLARWLRWRDGRRAAIAEQVAPWAAPRLFLQRGNHGRG